jgi:hypothetical protein
MIAPYLTITVLFWVVGDDELFNKPSAIAPQISIIIMKAKG